jgi:FtsH-binding integral membrane protein
MMNSSSQKNLPMQLMGASFASGAAMAYLYSRYLVRVQQEGSAPRNQSRWNGATPSNQRGAASSLDPIAALFNQNDISLRVLNHLARVYAALGGTTLAGVLGVIVQQRTQFSTTLASLFSLGFALSLQFSKSELWKLLAFGFFNGMGLGGLIKLAAHVNPAIIPIALGSSTLIFSSFAAAATLSSRRSLLYLYGGLGSALSIFSMTGLANVFIQSRHLFNFNLYGGLAMFVGYIAADSQLIVERADQGDEDYVTHAWMLFTDLSAIFSRIVIILIKQSEQDQQDKKKKKRGSKDEEFYD